MASKTCIKMEIAGFPITVEQCGVNHFRVTYGSQVTLHEGTEGLAYTRAATEFWPLRVSRAGLRGKDQYGCVWHC